MRNHIEAVTLIFVIFTAIVTVVGVLENHEYFSDQNNADNPIATLTVSAGEKDHAMLSLAVANPGAKTVHLDTIDLLKPHAWHLVVAATGLNTPLGNEKTLFDPNQHNDLIDRNQYPQRASLTSTMVTALLFVSRDQILRDPRNMLQKNAPNELPPLKAQIKAHFNDSQKQIVIPLTAVSSP